MATYQDYINNAFKNPEYLRAQEDYAKASKQLSDLTAQAPLYRKKRQQELEAADPELARLRQERAGLAGQLYSQPFQAREQYKDIFDPVARERLISQSVGNVLGQLGGTNELITSRRGTAAQQAEDALELFKAQIGAAEGLTTAAEKRTGDIYDTLRDVAKTQFQEDQDTMRARLKSGPSTTEKRDALKKSFNEDLTAYKRQGLVQVDAGGPGKLKREQIILDLAETYPELDPVEIANDVYKFFPSSRESQKAETQADILRRMAGEAGLTL